MKMLMILVLAVGWLNSAVGALTNAVPPKVEQDRLFMEAVMLKQYGRFAEAEMRLRRLAEMKPDEPIIKEMLAEVQSAARRQQDSSGAYGKQVAGIVVPNVNFRGIDPKEIVEQLMEESTKLTPDKSQVNIVWQVPADAKLRPVTLSLRNVPLLDVLRYVTELSGLRYRIDSRAIVIYLPEAAATKEPPPTNVEPK